MRRRKKIYFGIIIVVFLFLISSYLSHQYSQEIKNLIIIPSPASQLLYVLIMTSAVVFAPFETLPLLPIAVTLGGANEAAIYTIIGWVIGAQIAFYLGRRFGQKFVCRFVSKCDIEEYREILPKKNIFWLVVIARFVLPVDIISYTVGLFTKMNWLPYFFATLLGVIPFAFIFAHGAQLPLSLQIPVGIIVLLVIIFGYRNLRKKLKILLNK
ncbi:MAG: VTT domain-containing protein [Patescibacteria group bacterium]